LLAISTKGSEEDVIHHVVGEHKEGCCGSKASNPRGLNKNFLPQSHKHFTREMLLASHQLRLASCRLLIIVTAPQQLSSAQHGDTGIDRRRCIFN